MTDAEFAAIVAERDELRRRARAMPIHMWYDDLTERELKEIEFARLYAAKFSHGTDGHNAKLIIAKLADKLDAQFYYAPAKEESSTGQG